MGYSRAEKASILRCILPPDHERICYRAQTEYSVLFPKLYLLFWVINENTKPTQKIIANKPIDT